MSLSPITPRPSKISSVLSAGTLTMSSREIAELCGKRHDHVMRDIRDMLAQLYGEGGLPKFGGTYQNEQNGQTYPIFNLPKRETLILVSGYNLAVRARIVDRWQELETGPQFSIPQTYAEALKLAATQAEQIDVLLPKAAVHDRLVDAEGSLTLRKAAKALNIPERIFIKYLSMNDWIFRQHGDGDWLGYAPKTKSGDLIHKVTTLPTSEGERVVEQVRITPQGLTKLAKLLTANRNLPQ